MNEFMNEGMSESMNEERKKLMNETIKIYEPCSV